MSGPVRLGVVRDFRAEGWPSMDLCADQLLAHLPVVFAAGPPTAGAFPPGDTAAPPAPPPPRPTLAAADLAPPFRRRFQKLPALGARRAAFNADRLLNRHVYLPRFLRRAAAGFDLFHVVDHTYAHAVTALPPGRAGVYCHDLDAFRSVLDPDREPRPWWFRRLARRTLEGLKRAAVVFHNSREVGRQLADAGLVPRERLVHAPLGVSAEFTPRAAGPVEFPTPGLAAGRFLLHVGSNIPRKRLDVLLDVVAAVRERVPGVRLVQVGGPWPPHLAGQIGRLNLGPAVTQVRDLGRGQLAELYRRAAAVLVTSEAEGFGLPVIEALACGAAVVASDLPVLREVGGVAVVYRPVGNVPAWAEAVTRVLTEPRYAPPRDTRLSQAARYSWHQHARVIGAAYLRLAERCGLVPPPG
jgi:glycosyltransferase involved in cell wall biosynthesis